ncbi:hypothetical protein [Halorubellus sp. PRR65]|uniref:hypothetical protein n=1 Tax=Halorubellus sp. PRR65 TaxID=3098148 RepID=UPI002B259AAF|nr:hypothetical protein [Halorubellus sp. PRR65]
MGSTAGKGVRRGRRRVPAFVGAVIITVATLVELRREYARGNVDECEVDERLDELTGGNER